MANNMKAFKVRTYNCNALSALLQEKIFALGYTWSVGDTEIYRKYHDTLFCSSNGIVAYGAYREGDEPEITIDELFQMKAAQPETLKIGNHTYNKEEVEAALKNIKAIS